MFKMVNNNNVMFQGNVAAVLEEFVGYDGVRRRDCGLCLSPVGCCHRLLRRSSNSYLPFERFVKMNEKYPMLLFPAFKVQASIQDATLGTCARVHVVLVLAVRVYHRLCA
jgi:hypothetical protein